MNRKLMINLGVLIFVISFIVGIIFYNNKPSIKKEKLFNINYDY